MLMSRQCHLSNKLEYKFLGCIPVHYQSRMTNNGIAITPSRFHGAGRTRFVYPMQVQAGLGWGEEAQDMCTLHAGGMWWFLVLGDLVTRRHFP